MSATPANLTPRVRRILDRARYLAQELGHDCISIDMVICGALEEGRGIAVNVLRKRGVTAAEIRALLQPRAEGAAR